MNKKANKNKLLVRIVCLILAALMVLSVAYMAIYLILI